MQHLTTIRNQDFDTTAPKVDSSSFSVREAARAVVFDGEKVALLKVSKHNYYKIPGGGIEAGEDKGTALTREVKEEIGCKIEVIEEVGSILEYKDETREKQTSYCYIANKVGATGTPAFTDKELMDGFEVVWASNITDAIELAEKAKPDNYEGHFIKKRDLAFLKVAKSLV